MTTHLRMNGVYWGLCALELMGRGDVLPREDLVSFVKSCWDDPSKHASTDKGKAKAIEGQDLDQMQVSGGFAPFPRHDAHILSTLSALQILAMKDALDVIDRAAVIKCQSCQQRLFGMIADCAITVILSLRATDPSLEGAFYGDSTQLEHDTRFLYCSVYSLLLLGAHDELVSLRDSSITYILRCMNADGGFGTGIGAESHSGQGQ